MFVTIKKLTGLLVCTSALMAVGAVQAQERAAASSLETQMTWSTLSKAVEAANSNSAAANARVDQIAKCSLKYKLYAPEGRKKGLSVDSDGCIFNQPLLDLTDRVKKTEDAVVETNAKLSDLETYTKAQVTRIDTAITGLADKVGKLDTRVGKVEESMDKLALRVKSVEDQIVVVNGKIATLTGTVEDHGKRLDSHDKKLEALQKDVDAAKERLALAEKRLTTAEANIKTNTADIKDNTADIKTNTADIAALEKDVAAAKTRLTKAESLLTSHTAQIAALDKDVTALGTRMTTAEGTIKVHGTLITEINKDIVAINKSIATLQKDVDALDVRVADVQEDMNRVLNCGKANKLYNPTTKACVNAAAEASKRWTLSSVRTITEANMFTSIDSMMGMASNQEAWGIAGMPKCAGMSSALTTIGQLCSGTVTACYTLQSVGQTAGSNHNSGTERGIYELSRFACK